MAAAGLRDVRLGLLLGGRVSAGAASGLWGFACFRGAENARCGTGVFGNFIVWFYNGIRVPGEGRKKTHRVE
ncbi:hypothetical protein GCM10023178_06310 [Actinomadura luteofluorescens]